MYRLPDRAVACFELLIICASMARVLTLNVYRKVDDILKEGKTQTRV